MTTATIIRRFSRDEYHQMARSGILRQDERVELIHKEIVTMTPQGTPHAVFINFLDAQLQQVFGEQAAVRSQLPLSLGEASEPEPDLAIVPGQPLDYVQAHPITRFSLWKWPGPACPSSAPIKRSCTRNTSFLNIGL